MSWHAGVRKNHQGGARGVSCCLAALAALSLGGCTGGSAGPPAAAAPHRGSGAALRASLKNDLSQYLTAQRYLENISAVGLAVAFRGSEPGISLAAGTTRYGGRAPVPASALWQIGSNTKAFTSVLLLQLEAEGKLSISDPLGQWLPRYRAWRSITIRRLLDMTSRIPDYTEQAAFLRAQAAAPARDFSAARLVSYAAGLPPGPKGYHYSNTDYILAQMIIERVTHDSYAGQLMKRIIIPLRLRSLCYAPYRCPAAAAARMPAGYFFVAGVPQLASLLGKPVPPLALTWAQGAGGIVSSLPDMTTWDRALYQGQELPARQQRQLETLVSTATGQPIRRTTLADPSGYGLGVAQLTSGPAGSQYVNWPPGTVWLYGGETLGYMALHVYFPRSGLIIAVAVNSATGSDQLGNLVGSVYQTLQKAGAVHDS